MARVHTPAAIIIVLGACVAAGLVEPAQALEPLTSAIIAQKVVQTSVAMFVRPMPLGRLMPTELRVGRVVLRGVQHRLAPYMMSTAATATTDAVHSNTALTAGQAPSAARATARATAKWQRAVRSFGRVKVVVRKYAHWCMYMCNVCVASTACGGGLDADEATGTPLALMVLRDVLQDTLQSI